MPLPQYWSVEYLWYIASVGTGWNGISVTSPRSFIIIICPIRSQLFSANRLKPRMADKIKLSLLRRNALAARTPIAFSANGMRSPLTIAIPRTTANKYFSFFFFFFPRAETKFWFYGALVNNVQYKLSIYRFKLSISKATFFCWFWAKYIF